MTVICQCSLPPTTHTPCYRTARLLPPHPPLPLSNPPSTSPHRFVPYSSSASPAELSASLSVAQVLHALFLVAAIWLVKILGHYNDISSSCTCSYLTLQYHNTPNYTPLNFQVPQYVTLGYPSGNNKNMCISQFASVETNNIQMHANNCSSVYTASVIATVHTNMDACTFPLRACMQYIWGAVLCKKEENLNPPFCEISVDSYHYISQYL